MLHRLEDMKLSQIKELFYNTLMVLFTQGAETEEQYQFAKGLIDHMMRIVTECTEKGLDEAMLPIAYLSVWQGMKSGDKGVFSFRVSTAGGRVERDNNLKDLLERLKRVINEWGDESFGGFVGIDAKDNSVKWNMEE